MHFAGWEMTEEEWLACTDAGRMFCWLEANQKNSRASVLKLTRRLQSLMKIAWVRATPQAISDPFLLRTTEAIEQAVETDRWQFVKRLHREADDECERAAYAEGLRSIRHCWAMIALRLIAHSKYLLVADIPMILLEAIGQLQGQSVQQKEYAGVVRDIAGNPFRGGRGCHPKRWVWSKQREPIFRPWWRTDTVLSLARTMYEARDFSAMPILADALQDAGCSNEDILDHCRQPGEHVRGCWVVDLLLGKS